MLQADIDQINKVVKVLDDVGNAVDAIDVRTSAKGLGHALKGCDVAPECIQAAEYIEGAYLRLADRLRQVATKMTDCASNLATTDDQFSQSLHAFDIKAH